ncbi:hypothetical protein Tco_1507520 [Tanacetum coccineum]
MRRHGGFRRALLSRCHRPCVNSNSVMVWVLAVGVGRLGVVWVGVRVVLWMGFVGYSGQNGATRVQYRALRLRRAHVSVARDFLLHSNTKRVSYESFIGLSESAGIRILSRAY